MILDKMWPGKCHLLFGFFFIAQHEERPLYHVHMVTSRFLVFPSSKEMDLQVSHLKSVILLEKTHLQGKYSCDITLHTVCENKLLAIQ